LVVLLLSSPCQDPEGRHNLEADGSNGVVRYRDQEDQQVERYTEGGCVKERIQVSG
jgi:hypothetical protein